MIAPRIARAPNPVGGGEAQRAARAELRRAGYDHGGRGPLSRILDWVGRHLGSLLSGGGGAGSHALLVAVVVLVAVAVVFAVRAGAPNRRVRGDDAGPDPLAPQAARDHRRLAEALTRDGRRSEALREWLRAAVQTIEERGVLPPRPGRTGAATAHEAGPLLPAAAAELAAAVGAFDEVWFGGRVATDADVALARAAADGVASSRIARAASVPQGMEAPL